MSLSSSYVQVIGEAKYHFLSEENGFRAALRSAILKAGRKKVIFVEGYGDKMVFERLYEEHSSELCFIDVSLEKAKINNPKVKVKVIDECDKGPGACDKVKSLLSCFIKFLPQEKRFYGVIDRDLKTDQEVEADRNKVCYDGRLFIFFERYTLENYFISLDALKAFIHGQSDQHKKLIQLVDDDVKLEEIMADIISCLAKIAAANLTIRFFDKSAKFLVEDTINCSDEIEKRVHHRLKGKCEDYVEAFVNAKFQLMKEFIMQSYPDNVQKFASAKEYFATQFNKRLKADYKVNLQINNHKPELVSFLKAHPPWPNDFNELLKFLGVIS